MVHLLCLMNTAVMLVSLILFHSFCSLMIGLLYLVENLLKFVEIDTAPGLKFHMVTLR